MMQYRFKTPSSNPLVHPNILLPKVVSLAQRCMCLDFVMVVGLFSFLALKAVERKVLYFKFLCLAALEGLSGHRVKKDENGRVTRFSQQ
jgi:hypothetical protein